MDEVKKPYRYAVGKRVTVDRTSFNSFTILEFNYRNTFTSRNAKKHIMKCFSNGWEKELYLLKLDNGVIVDSRKYEAETHKCNCMYCTINRSLL